MNTPETDALTENWKANSAGWREVAYTMKDVVQLAKKLELERDNLRAKLDQCEKAIESIYNPQTGCEDFGNHFQPKQVTAYSFHKGSVVDNNLRAAIPTPFSHVSK